MKHFDRLLILRKLTFYLDLNYVRLKTCFFWSIATLNEQPRHLLPKPLESSFGFISIALTNAFTWSLKALVKVCCTKLFASFDSRIGKSKNA